MEKKVADKLLYEALCKLLLEKSIDKLSVTEIIDESGVSKATFYRYYCDKYDLFNSHYLMILKDTLYLFNQGISWRETSYNLYHILKKDVKLFQNAFRSSDVNCLKNYIFNKMMDFHLEVLAKNGIDIHDWKIKKLMEAHIRGCLEITIIWILEGAKEPIEDLLDVMESEIPSQFSPYFLPDKQA